MSNDVAERKLVHLIRRKEEVGARVELFDVLALNVCPCVSDVSETFPSFGGDFAFQISHTHAWMVGQVCCRRCTEEFYANSFSTSQTKLEIEGKKSPLSLCYKATPQNTYVAR